MRGRRTSLAIVALLMLATMAAAAERTVQPGESIAAALRAAKPGDTVRVLRGFYSERLVIDKPLGLSPKGIEFKRAHLYDVNPVGVGSMGIAAGSALVAANTWLPGIG